MASVPRFGPRPAPRQAFQEYKVSVKQTLLWEQATPRTLIEDLPVFDRGKDQAAWGGRVATATFARVARDRRQGTPVPPEMTGDPQTDRGARQPLPDRRLDR